MYFIDFLYLDVIGFVLLFVSFVLFAVAHTKLSYKPEYNPKETVENAKKSFKPAKPFVIAAVIFYLVGAWLGNDVIINAFKLDPKSIKERELIEAFEELGKVAPALNAIQNMGR